MKSGMLSKLIALVVTVAAIIALSSLVVRRQQPKPESQPSGRRGSVSEIVRNVRPKSPTASLTATAHPVGPIGESSKDSSETMDMATSSPRSSSDPDDERHPVDSLQMMSLEVRNNPGDIRLLIGELKKETDPNKIAILAELIARNADVDELPMEDLLGIMGSEDASRRNAALQILGKSKRITPDVLAAVEQVSKTDPDLAVRERSITTMGEWMQNSGQMSDAISAALIKTKDATDNPDLRRYAIQTLKDNPAGVPSSAVDSLDVSLRTDALAHNRSMAALALAYVKPEAVPAALEKLQSAYMQETSTDVRRHMITMIMRAGNVDALSIVSKLPTPDPLLAQDVRDYTEIVKSGEKDIVKIIGTKLSRDMDRGTDTNGSPQ